jgi:O-antigen/teichoic acid export membrane protein
MGIVRSVAKNSLAMGLVQIIGQISTLVLAVFLSRNLGADYTSYTSAFSVATVLFILADFGLGFQMVVEVAPAKHLAPRYLTNTLLLRAALSAVALAATAVFVLVEGLPAEVAYAYLIIALSTVFNWFAQTFASMFTAFERMHYVLMTSLVERLFTVSLSILLVLAGLGLGAVVLVVLAGSLLNLVLSYLVCARLIVRPAPSLDIAGTKAQFKDALTYAINSALTSSLYALNGFLVLTMVMGMYGLDAGELANTEFSVAFNLVVSLIAIPTVFRMALLPTISRLYHSSMDLAKLTQQKVMKYMFALGLPLTVGGFILSDKIIALFFPNYPASAAVFRVLIPVIAIAFFGTGMTSVLASAKLMRLNTISTVIGAAVNLLLCIALIPLTGAAGAAFAFTVSTFATNLISLYYLEKRIFKVDLADIVVRPMMAAVGMAAVLLLIPQADFFVSLVVGAGTYFILLFAVKTFGRDDTDIFKKVLNKGA